MLGIPLCLGEDCPMGDHRFEPFGYDERLCHDSLANLSIK